MINKYINPDAIEDGSIGKEKLAFEPAEESGYYSNMTVGKAENLVGRGESTEEEFSFRPSAGSLSIEDGTAKITSIKGNSVVYNQLITNSRFETTRNYNVAGGATLNIDGGIATITLGNSNHSGLTNVELYENLVVGHKYLFITEAKADAEMQNVLIPYVLSSSASPKNTVSTEWRSYSFIYGATSNTMSYGVARAGIYGTDFQGGEKIYAKSFRVIDLTQMFSAGNEPTTYEDYLQRKPMNIEDEYAYNAGELIDMNVDSLVSVGDNAYNPELGYARVLGGKEYNIHFTVEGLYEMYFSRTLNGEKEDIIGANPMIFPADGYVWVMGMDGEPLYSDKVCICLQHSYPKPVIPYEQDVKDLSFISELFPNGMRSAGSVFDEIRFNPTKKVWEKVTRIGAVDLGSLGWSDVKFNSIDAFRILDVKDSVPQPWGVSNNAIIPLYTPKANFTQLQSTEDKVFTLNGSGHVENTFAIRDSSYTDAASFKQAMQEKGVMLYYELAEPIIEDLNIDLTPYYEIWDFGTEEAIASGASTPFRADIIYQFNAVDRIRNNSTKIEELESKTNKNATDIATKQKTLTLSVKDNDNIVIGNLDGQTKEFMPATPSGDPMHYAYEASGAIYDDASGLWSYRADEGGLSDITTDQMRVIWDDRLAGYQEIPNGKWFASSGRTNIYRGNQPSGTRLNSVACNNSNLEVFCCGVAMIVQSGSYLLRSCAKLHTVVGVLKAIYGAINSQSFSNLPKLQNIKVMTNASISFADSPNLSKESILYMINNEAATSAIVITLHATAYAMAMADADIRAALAEHTNVSLGNGSASE